MYCNTEGFNDFKVFRLKYSHVQYNVSYHSNSYNTDHSRIHKTLILCVCVDVGVKMYVHDFVNYSK